MWWKPLSELANSQPNPINMKVAVIIGHSRTDPGAVNKTRGIGEFAFNEDVGKRICEKINVTRCLDCELIYRRASYGQMVKDVNATRADFAIELHANSIHDTNANRIEDDGAGTEMLFYAHSKYSRELARIMQKQILRMLKLRDRGLVGIVKGGEYRMPISYEGPVTAIRMGPGGRGHDFLRYANMPAIICEPFFMSNTQELDYATKNKALLIDGYVLGCMQFAGALEKMKGTT